MEANLWYIQVTRLLREISKKAREAQKARGAKLVETITGYLRTDFEALKELWPKDTPCAGVTDLGRHIYFGMKGDFHDILEHDVPTIERAAEKHFLQSIKTHVEEGFESLLHPVILESSYPQFRSGHYRDAVLNCIIGLGDYIRKATGLNLV